MEIQCVWHYHIFLYLDLVAPKSNDFIATEFFFVEIQSNGEFSLDECQIGLVPPHPIFFCVCVVSVRGVDKAEVVPIGPHRTLLRRWSILVL